MSSQSRQIRENIIHLEKEMHEHELLSVCIFVVYEIARHVRMKPDSVGSNSFWKVLLCIFLTMLYLRLATKAFKFFNFRFNFIIDL